MRIVKKTERGTITHEIERDQNWVNENRGWMNDNGFEVEEAVVNFVTFDEETTELEEIQEEILKEKTEIKNKKSKNKENE